MPLTIGTVCAPRMSLIIADDCPAMREGLARLISDECDIVVANSAATAAELRGCITQQVPQVVLLELTLGDDDGLALIRDLLEMAPKLRIVVFTFQPEEVYAERCLRAGARAYISKRDSVAALFRTIRRVADGEIVVPASVSEGMVGIRKAKAPAATATGTAAQLTDRELQVFRLVGLAQPTRVIATKLGVSVKTIETHREHIKDKLSLQSHGELVARAAQWVRENDGN